MGEHKEVIAELTVNKIKDLISKGKISIASIYLRGLTQIFDPSKENEVLILNAEICDLMDKDRKGVLDDEKERLVRRQLMDRFLKILDTINISTNYEKSLYDL